MDHQEWLELQEAEAELMAQMIHKDMVRREVCKLRWDVFADASADPEVNIRVTCIAHGISGESGAFPVKANIRAWQRDRALSGLKKRHEIMWRYGS